MPSYPQYELDPCRLELGQRVHQALVARLPEGATLSFGVEDIGRLFEKPPEAAMGDYALPCFRFAKDLKLKPQEVAQAVADTLNAGGAGGAGGWLLKADVASAFLNIFINPAEMAQAVLPDVLSGASFRRLAGNAANARQRVMIEYSQPNTHKEFHVGHGRNVCLGNSLVRLFRACGYQVVSANYFGDDGTHIARELWYISKFKKVAPETNKGEWLGQMYVESTNLMAKATDEEKAVYTAEISQVHRQIETKTGDIYKLWQETRQWSLDSFGEIYDWLDVHFDVLFYESEVTDAAQEIVAEYEKKGVFVLDQGAIGVDLKPYKLGFCILRKRDGNTLYATKDLALARLKFEQYKIDRSIYVVADEQNHHFRQVFKVLELMGFEQAKHCSHLSYGMVVLPEGKMSSREGNSVTFNSLRQLMMNHLSGILTKYAGEWTEAELQDTAHKLCDGAIKFGMMATDPAKEIVFNLEDWLSFEGHSGPYLMYSYSRTRSILRKAADQGFKPEASQAAVLTQTSERELLRYLFDYNDVVAVACETSRPSHLASHLFYMCKSFNRFYADVSVLKAETPALRDARLALIEAFSTTLRQGLSLLGITPPDRM